MPLTSISCSLFSIKYDPTHKLFFVFYEILLFFRRPQEIFNWLLLVDDRDYDVWDQPRISWHIKYQRPPPVPDSVGHHGTVSESLQKIAFS